MSEVDIVIASISFYCRRLDKDVRILMPQISITDGDEITIKGCECGKKHFVVQ